MTVTINDGVISYTGDGSTTVFAYDFLIFADADMAVYFDNVKQVTGYTVSGAGTGSGNVTFAVAPAAGVKITLRSEVADTQPVVYTIGGKFPAQTHEGALDRRTIVSQQRGRDIARALKVAIDSANLDLLVPTPETGRFLRWKDATALENADIVATGGVGLPVSFANGGTSGNYASAIAVAQGLALALWRRGADISASATLALLNPLDGNYMRVTGNTGVSAISTTGVNEGTIIALQFTGTPTLTHGASFALQGDVNYTCVANDMLFFQLRTGAVWKEVARVVSGGTTAKFWRGDGTWQFTTLHTTTGPTDLAIGAIADGQVLQRSGSSVVGLTSPFTSEFVSSDQTVTLSSTLNVAHGLGVRPKLWQVVLKCNTAESNYTVGDEIVVGGGVEAGVDSGVLAVADATNVTIVTSTAMAILNKTTRVAVNITAANWRYVVRAWK